jgi:hypothetical protein
MSWVDWPAGEYNPFTTPQTPPDTGILDADGVCIRLNQDWIPAIIGALNLLTIPASWASNQDFAMQQGEKVINEIATAAGFTVITFTLPAGSEPTFSKVGCTIYIGVPITPASNLLGGGAGGELNGTEQDNDMMQIIKIGGVAYLTYACGCGDTELYRLTPASVQVDTKTGNASVLSALDSQKTSKIPAVASDNLSCFAEQAVPYLLDRAYQFASALETIIEEGVSALSGSIGDWLDIGGIVQMVLLGGATDLYDLIVGHSLTDIENAYLDSTFQQTMLDAWSYSGNISRADLREWVQAAPVYVGLGSEPESLWPINGWKMRYALQQWVNFSLLSGLADDLQEYAAQCNTGVTLEGINYAVNVGEGYSEVTINGDTYPVWDWVPSDGENIGNTDPAWVATDNGPMPAGTDLVGLAIETPDGGGDYFVQTTHSKRHGYLGAGKFGVAVSADVATILTTTMSGTDVDTNTSTGENSYFDGVRWAYYTDPLTITRCVAVGAAL